MSAPSLPQALALLKECLRIQAPGVVPVAIRITTTSGLTLVWPFVDCNGADGSSRGEGNESGNGSGATGQQSIGPVFLPNGFQIGVLNALEGRALRTDALANELRCSRSQMFRHPGGIKELRAQGLVDNHPRLGYYRVDAPPPELSELGNSAS